MAEITFIADPGADDILIDGISLNDIDAFRAECLTNGAVSCDWDTLHTRLIGHDVSRFWWFLTRDERYSITVMAIENTDPYPHQVLCWRAGKLNCEGGEGDIAHAECLANALIRYVKFGSTTGLKSKYNSPDQCYWSVAEGWEEHCYDDGASYELPVAYVSRLDGHFITAVQIDTDVHSLDNWVMFQYGTIDIQPGTWHAPSGCDLEFLALSVFNCNQCGGNPITRFDNI